jgi:hypothetical protein
LQASRIVAFLSTKVLHSKENERIGLLRGSLFAFGVRNQVGMFCLAAPCLPMPYSGYFWQMSLLRLMIDGMAVLGGLMVPRAVIACLDRLLTIIDIKLIKMVRLGIRTYQTLTVPMSALSMN